MNSKELQNYDPRQSANLSKMLEDAKVLIESGLVPQKKPEDVVVVMQLAKELNMSVVLALASVHNIQGRASIGIHLWNALLTKNGVSIELVEDSVPVYHIKKANGIRIILTEEELENSKYYAMSPTQKWEDVKDHVPSGKEVVLLVPAVSMPLSIPDRRTTVRMRRKSATGIDVAERCYYYHEAWAAGYVYLDDGKVVGKDNWIYHVKDMMFARACTRTGKVVGPDYTLGFSEISEIADTFDYEVGVTDDGDTVIIEETNLD